MKSLVGKYAYWPEIAAPYQRHVDFSSVMLMDIFPVMESQTREPQQNINAAIFQWYAYNEMIGQARHKHEDLLPEEFLEVFHRYHQLNENLSQKIFTYIFVCSFAEARHSYLFSNLNRIVQRYLEDNHIVAWVQASPMDFFNACQTPEYQQCFGHLVQPYAQHFSTAKDFERFCLFLRELNFFSFNSTFFNRDEMQEEILNPYTFGALKGLRVGQALSCLEKIFKHTVFEAGYGGQAWEKIVHHAQCFAKGQINEEVFIDQAFSFQHNSGNLFSKRFLFSAIDDEIMLDIQLFKPQATQPCHTLFYATDVLLNAQHQQSVMALIADNWTHLNGKDIDFSPHLMHLAPEQKLHALDCVNNIRQQFAGLKNYLVKINHEFLQDNAAYTSSCKISHLSKILFPSPDIACIGSHVHEHIVASQGLFSLMDETNTKPNMATQPAAQDDTWKIHDLSIHDHALSPELIGKKAHAIMEMNQLAIKGLQLPKAVVLDSRSCLAYFNNKVSFHQEYLRQNTVISTLFEELGQPSMVSVRSTAATSMPGMMDTILNVGIDDANYDALVRKYGGMTVEQCAVRFMQDFAGSLWSYQENFPARLQDALVQFKDLLTVHGIPYDKSRNFPLDRHEQVWYSVRAVFESSRSPRVMAWKEGNHIKTDMPTAAIIQKMVLGNLNEQSLSAVVFSRDCITGQPGILGEYLRCSQGDDIVSGRRTPRNISLLKQENMALYEDILNIAQQLEKHYGAIQDIELTVEDGQLYILQRRNTACTQRAKYHLMLYSGNEQAAFPAIMGDLPLQLFKSSAQLVVKDKPSYQGISANGGVLRGIIVTSMQDMEKYQPLFERYGGEDNFGWVFHARQSTPEHAPMMMKTHAFLTQEGGATCHAAILARSLDKPCIVAMGATELHPGTIVSIDAYTGGVWVGMLPVEHNNTLAMQLSRHLIEASKEDSHSLVQQSLHEPMAGLNEMSSWMQTLPNSCVMDNMQSKKFLSVAQKAAMLIVKRRSHLRMN